MGSGVDEFDGGCYAGKFHCLEPARIASMATRGENCGDNEKVALALSSVRLTGIFGEHRGRTKRNT